MRINIQVQEVLSLVLIVEVLQYIYIYISTYFGGCIRIMEEENGNCSDYRDYIGST